MNPEIKFNKIQLDNGLKLITLPLEKTKVVTLLVLVGTGSKYETKEKNGLSHFLEHMVFKGTKSRPNPLDIAKELDSTGGAYNAFTSKEYTGFWVKAESSHFDKALDVLADILFNSLYKLEDIEKEKLVIQEEINMYRDDPKEHICDLWEKLLYGDQPAGWPIAGTKKTVASFTREDILKYLENQFTAPNMVIAVAGSFKETKVQKAIARYFSKATKKLPLPKPKVKEIQEKPQVLLEFRKTQQTHLCLGVRTFDLFHKDKYILNVLSVLLGGIMSSRLFYELREKRGLCYYVATSPEYYTDSGYLVTQAGVDTKRCKEAIQVILKEYVRLTKEPVLNEELQRAKEALKGRLALKLETSDALASYFGIQELLKKEIILPDQEYAKIDQVSSKDILRLANEIFVNTKLNLALIGPFKDKEEFENLLSF